MAVAVGAGAVTGVVVARRRRRPETDRWHSVTINCSPEQLGPKPRPLDELAFPVEVRIRPAPGDRGTELSVRVASDAGRQRVRDVRKALRAARSLAEVGEVLLPDTPPTTRPTITGAPLAYATRHGREEGRL
ncbi:hypothetical protein ACPPVO_31560 [Dactylosporangium sp. McL0621]|uniref:hypothetical protein n=1 Tax=Dactylosporangium sp. McL0621 TaxID=3415678 RepID=UPI003CEF087A